MKTLIIPGPRDEEAIAYAKKLIEEAKNCPEGYDNCEAYYELSDLMRTSEGSDAVYYASEGRERALADQAAYFDFLLIDAEDGYFLKRLTGFECNWSR